MKTIYLATTCCALFATMAHAEKGVLVDHVPGGAESDVVINVIRTALINREWKVTGIGANSVDAKLDHSQTKATIRVVFSEGRLLYEGEATSTYRVGPTPSNPLLTRVGNIPERWVSYLRRDISATLSTLPEHR